ncbi:ADP-forming succinate--CoA ligase subunit beta [Desulfitibacter alkalitolerans]|uniref:ADP-forming succinate--CoA ligase subunit beta n=1 Tax=Desulfitibacter alkalitolerans TaxID=264641 RepID=UPI00047F8AA9|nr:ADP-forming succinate--CoA ligase subunit beta [Desulfitibacter alkalitolerans]
MKLFEYQGKEIFKRAGIEVPRGNVASSPDAAFDIAGEIGESVLKIQILSGKRGKAGGIQFASSPEEAKNIAKDLFSKNYLGFSVDYLLVEEKLSIEKEYYAAITYDYKMKRPVILVSSQGGMDIEEVAEELIIKTYLEPNTRLEPYQGREIAIQAGIKGKQINTFSSMLVNLVDIFIDKDAELVEVNPLVLSKEKFIAADAKIVIDDDALFRQNTLPLNDEKNEIERKCHEIGLSYVQLDGDIAIMANGAGITMATLDLIQEYGGSPNNFLDAGGGANEEQTKRALELLLSTNPKGIFINIFGGITRTDDVARAFLKVREELDIKVPVVIRLIGTNQDKALDLLRNAGIEAYSDMELAAKTIVQKVRGA